MRTNSKQLSRLMKMSWEIQRNKRRTRSKSLQAAWAIIGNEDITVYYLVKRMSHQRPVRPELVNQLGLFHRN